jgi:hypothetical protein
VTFVLFVVINFLATKDTKEEVQSAPRRETFSGE